MSVKLAFYKGPTTWYGWAIKLWTMGPYTQCELIIDDQWFSAIEGVGSRYLLHPNANAARWDFVDIEVDAVQKAHMYNWCMSEMWCKYDWKGIWLSQVFGLRRQDPDKWFCSEFCAAALQIAGLYKGRPPHTYSPNSLHRLVKRSP